VLIIANATANAGRGAERWAAVERELRARRVVFEARLTASATEADEVVRSAIAAGERVIVAAGGDGTMNGVLNALMDPATDRPRGDVAFGAIGLGSSNDFHKPFAAERTIAGVPARVSSTEVRARDVGKAVSRLPGGGVRTRYFLLNASLGAVAQANAFFNAGDRVLRWLKPRSVEAAILYAALATIARGPRLRLALSLDGGPEETVTVSTMGILKSVHFAGGMRYDTKVTPDDGMFDVNLWERMGRVRLVRTMVSLYGGRFTGLPGARCLRARAVRIVPEPPVHLELDGEVSEVERAELSVLPGVLHVCG
jgi:diacylglycerol kinase family enzyme